MRRNRRDDQLVAGELLEELLRSSERIGGCFRVSHGKPDDALPQHAAQAGFLRSPRDLLLEVVHVREKRRPGLNHLERREPRAGSHERRADRFRFSREDVFLEPLHERQVVRQAAVQHHGRVGVRVDEARQDHGSGCVDRFGPLVDGSDGGRLADGDDGAPLDRDGPRRQDSPRRVHRDDGAAGDDERDPSGPLRHSDSDDDADDREAQHPARF